MECGFDKTLLTAWLEHQLTEEERVEVEEHLAGCEECRSELSASRHLWELMNDIPDPEPPAGTLVRFNAVLDSYKATATPRETGNGIVARIRQIFTINPGFTMAYSLLLVIAGIGLGHWLSTPAPAPASADRQQLESLTAQVTDMREMMMKTLLQNPSASERIRGVSYTSEIKTVNRGVVEALLTTLNNDPNVNVRLMTLEALTHYASNPAVREGLVQSILQQESPLVQAALADVMLKLQEKNAVRPFKKLLQQKNLNVLVRTRIEAAIARLG
ncbi:MAG TPA: HEAT repeat domain-containing protein [Puia sp.]|nr:HEAT repeat domain-containing protein [Puia sp.]